MLASALRRTIRSDPSVNPRDTLHHIDSMVQQEEKEDHKDHRIEESESKFFRISRRRNKKHRALLEPTSADWARGAIRMLKCRPCPSAGFGNWNDFKRQCTL